MSDAKDPNLIQELSANIYTYCAADWTRFPAVTAEPVPHGEQKTFTCERFLLCDDAAPPPEEVP